MEPWQLLPRLMTIVMLKHKSVKQRIKVRGKHLF